MKLIFSQQKHSPTGKYCGYALPALFLLLTLLFGGRALYEIRSLQQDRSGLERLSSLVDKTNNDTIYPAMEPETGLQFLPEYVGAAERNPDFYGWLHIAETVVDYPVMYTPMEPQKYLRKDFEGKYSLSGLPFMDSRCTDRSDNLIIYGHNMKNGTMFGSLAGYADSEYRDRHPIICFDTLYEKRKFEVFAAFYDQVYSVDQECFKFYDFIDAENQSDYEEAVEKLCQKSLYDTEIIPQYGNQLLTLSTCSYHVKNGRFVVVARRIS